MKISPNPRISGPDPYRTATFYGAPEGHDARILADQARVLASDGRVLAHVAVDDVRLATLADLLTFFAQDIEVISFPAWDCLPYDRVSPHADLVAKRVMALGALLDWQRQGNHRPRIVLTTVNAILQRVSPRGFLEQGRLNARAGGKLDPLALQDFLTRSGYVRTETVREAGEYAVRGGIIDLFPSGYEEPVRLDLFGEDIESIRTFDPSTQRTDKKIDTLDLWPVSEFRMDEESIARFRAAYRERFGAAREADPLYQAISEARRHAGAEHWLPLFFDKMETLLDYIPSYALFMDQHAAQAHAERLTQIEDFYQARKTLESSGVKKARKGGMDVSLSGAVYHPLPPALLYIEEKDWAALLQGSTTLSPFSEPGSDADTGARRGRDFSDIRGLPDGDVFKALAEHISMLRQGEHKILIAAYSEGSRDRLKGLMEHAGFGNLVLCATYHDVQKLKTGQTGLSVMGLEHGFVAPDLAVLTEQDILGDRLARRSRRKRRSDNFLTEVSSLNAGDLVVHIEHGVGRFEGLETIQAAGTLHDCLKVIYAGDDRLFIPVENIDVLSRFGSDEGNVHLDKLGGAGWQARKAKVKKDLMRMADQLLKIAAARELRRGETLRLDPERYNEFAARFPYHETDDQLRSINDVISDLEKDRPMDRLICGDVGFGKTEVALRAAYVAAMAGVQVAVITPTTLLCRQHYQTFSKRFAGTGLRVEQLSRLVTAKDVKAAKAGIADGAVNIVIGTHALFAKDLKFSHLGLLIIDEEQRFGVKQKERLKEIKGDVHILTLTATPIPRTLQMSLSGVKDMSLIATPPVDRLAIRTFVLPFDPVIVREALLREHYRGGQSFYVCPRISDIADVMEMLAELVPEVKVVGAHGQMSPSELEDRMTAFYDGQYDVLLATNIIESGIDIPSANTMIVHRSDLFGLAQLYQIRGRIGRAKVRAYAYLTYDPGMKLSAQAQKRLEVIETLDTLGAGFQLASHDMDIRGAGNLLGEEQSGHIKEIGVELYQQMLEEAVAVARAGGDLSQDVPDSWSPQINMGTSVMISESYVSDLTVRLSLYRRLAELEERQDIESFAAELIDRFGPLPDEVQNLLDIVAIKHLCRRAGVDRVDAGPKGAVISFHQNRPPHVEGLMKWMTGSKGAIRLRPDQKLVVARDWDNTAHRVKGVERLMKELADLAG